MQFGNCRPQFCNSWKETREIGWPSVKFKLRKNFLLFCNLNLDLNFRVSTFRGPNIRRAKQERRMRPCEKGARYSKRDTQYFFSSSYSTQFQCYSITILFLALFKRVLWLFNGTNIRETLKMMVSLVSFLLNLNRKWWYFKEVEVICCFTKTRWDLCIR